MLATKAATTCSSSEVCLLSQQMSHSVETHWKNYELMAHAAKAHKTIGRLESELEGAKESTEHQGHVQQKNRRKFKE